VTPAELDLLDAIQADIRTRYEFARHTISLWEPVDAPALSERMAAADVDRAGAQ
jgi:hypothetical protein